jgi:hypothetical protein
MRYVIQYEAVNGGHKMQDFDSRNRRFLAKHLGSFQRPIVAVYEQSTPITKAIRAEMAETLPLSGMSRYAKDFVNPPA